MHPASSTAQTLLRRTLRAAALALMIIPALPLLAGRATEPVVPPAAQPATPPRFQDTVHVPVGCFISTTAYLAKFAAEHPHEFGAPLTAFLGVIRRHHTSALVTWRGEWWLRDEYLGLIRLGVPVTRREITDRVARRAESTLEREAAKLSPELRARIAGAGQSGNSRIDAAREVAQAAALVPFPAETYLVTCGNREVPLLFFRPSPREIAVYDPFHGTATAETDSPRHAAIVELVAQRLGYRVTSVRRDFGPLVAQAAP